MVGNFMKTCHKAGDEKHKTSNRIKIDRCASALQLYSQARGQAIVWDAFWQKLLSFRHFRVKSLSVAKVR
jgi:hypothetical protein